jgi:hypothetical protein
VSVIDKLDPVTHKYDPNHVKRVFDCQSDFYIWDDFVDHQLLLEAR